MTKLFCHFEFYVFKILKMSYHNDRIFKKTYPFASNGVSNSLLLPKSKEDIIQLPTDV